MLLLSTELLINHIFPSTYNMSLHCLLAYVASIEKSEVKYIVVPLHVTRPLSPVTFTISSRALVFNNLTIMCSGVYLSRLILPGVH